MRLTFGELLWPSGRTQIHGVRAEYLCNRARLLVRLDATRLSARRQAAISPNAMADRMNIVL